MAQQKPLLHQPTDPTEITINSLRVPILPTGNMCQKSYHPYDSRYSCGKMLYNVANASGIARDCKFSVNEFESNVDTMVGAFFDHFDPVDARVDPYLCSRAGWVGGFVHGKQQTGSSELLRNIKHLRTNRDMHIELEAIFTLMLIRMNVPIHSVPLANHDNAVSLWNQAESAQWKRVKEDVGIFDGQKADGVSLIRFLQTIRVYVVAATKAADQ